MMAMKLKIRVCGETVLRKVALPVEKPFGRLEPFVRNMIETMHAAKGVGLAAPQVNRSIRVFVYDAGEAGGGEEGDRVCINPVITWRSETLVPYEEGCLSIPDLNAEVLRPDKVRLQAWSLDGFRFTVDAEGLEARVIQHEFDHLEGILFTDLIGDGERERVERAIAKIQKRAALPAEE